MWGFSLFRLNHLSISFLGSDGWKGDWVKVYTTDGYDGTDGMIYECFYSSFLDGDDSELGRTCSTVYSSVQLLKKTITPK